MSTGTSSPNPSINENNIKSLMREFVKNAHGGEGNDPKQLADSFLKELHSPQTESLVQRCARELSEDKTLRKTA